MMRSHSLQIANGQATCHPNVRQRVAFAIVAWLACAIVARTQEATNESGAERLWRAARTGDVDGVARELDAGTEVDSTTQYQSTALSFACDRGHIEVVRLLLQRGANPNVKDSFYKASPLTWAQYGKHYEVVTTLLEAGATGANSLVLDAIADNNKSLLEAALNSHQVDSETLSVAAALATAQGSPELIAIFEGQNFNRRPPPNLSKPFVQGLTGTYASRDGDSQIIATSSDTRLFIDQGFGGPQEWYAIEENRFQRGSQYIRFQLVDGIVKSLMLRGSLAEYEYLPSAVSDSPKDAKGNDNRSSPESIQPKPTTDTAAPQNAAKTLDLLHRVSESDLGVSSANWPGFRGYGSRGIADGQNPPKVWDVAKGINVAWKCRIAGFGNSSPVLWDDRLFITSAVSKSGNQPVQIGIYGDVDSINDENIYDFTLHCLNKKTGEILWERICKTSKPTIKRHSKSSHANPTVATDGSTVVAWFGSEGLYAFDLNGQPKWSRDLGVLDSGWFYDPSYQWGFGSSPCIFNGRLYLQCDIQNGSFLTALDLNSGTEIWRSQREEIPTWSTPIVHLFGDIPVLITHGTRAARGYDARDGQLLWWLADHSEIVVPTPNVSHGLIYLSSGYAPIQPIVAVRPEARGEIRIPGRKLKDGEETPATDPGVAWSTERGGPYMPTPVLYGDYLYVCSNSGVVTCYKARSGELVYKKRLTGGIQSFTASPIAADGHLYFTAEDGTVIVIKAGGVFEQVHINPAETKVLSTPAISEGTFYLRTTDEVIALRDHQSQNNTSTPP